MGGVGGVAGEGEGEERGDVRVGGEEVGEDGRVGDGAAVAASVCASTGGEGEAKDAREVSKPGTV